MKQTGEQRDQAERTHKFIIWGLALVLLFFPLVIAPQVISGQRPDLFSLPRLIFLRIITVPILIAWFFWLLKTGELWRFKSNMSWPVLAFLFSLILSTAFSSDSVLSFWGSYSYEEGFWTSANFILLFFVALTSIRTRENLEWLLNVILLGSGVIALYALLQRIGFDPFPWPAKEGIFATLGNPDALGHYLAMILPLAVVKVLLTLKRDEKAFFFVFLLFFFFALLFTESRSAWWGAIGALAFFFAFAIPDFRQRASRLWERNRKWVLVFIGIVLVILLILLPFSAFGKGVVSRAWQALSPDENATRFLSWSRAILTFTAAPALGFGPETFANAYKSLKTIEEAPMEPDTTVFRSGNQYLDFLAQYGVIGFLTFIGIIVAFLSLSFRLWRKTNHSHSRLLLVGIGSSVFSYLLGNIFTSPALTSTLYFWVFLGLMGAAESIPFPVKETKEKKLRKALDDGIPQRTGRPFSFSLPLRVILGFLLTGLVAFLLFFSVRQAIADFAFGLGERETFVARQLESEATNEENPENAQKLSQKAVEEWKKAVNSYSLATSLVPWESVYRGGTSDPLHNGCLAAALFQLSAHAEADEKIELAQRSREEYQSALQHSLEKELIYNALASTFQNEANSDSANKEDLLLEAMSLLRMSIEQDRAFFPSYQNMAEIYQELARLKEATEDRKSYLHKAAEAGLHAVEIRPNNSSAHLLLAEIYLDLYRIYQTDSLAGEDFLMKARDEGEKAAALDPNSYAPRQFLSRLNLLPYENPTLSP